MNYVYLRTALEPAQTIPQVRAVMASLDRDLPLQDLLERLGLARIARRLPTELSGGEQQRLAIARALINDPALVLADEPTGNLDEESGADVLNLLRRLTDSDRSVVLVTHDRAATRIADRVLRLEGGRLVA